MAGSILYCGDTDQNGAASYLSGLMALWGWPFDYVPSHVPIPAKLLEVPRSLIILSDYPSARFDLDCQQLAIKQVEQGCGLLMIGGWESFHGFGGDWDGTVLGSALPVEIQTRDDRVNFDQSAWLIPCFDHAITEGLPWYSSPPAIGGMNRVRAKGGTSIVMEAHSFAISVAEPADKGETRLPTLSLSPRETLLALVVGQRGMGRTAAFLGDVAPHWVGGFVDWGMPRVSAQAPNAGAIEVGGHYARFWKQLLEWTANCRR